MANPVSRMMKSKRAVQWMAAYEAGKVLYEHGRRLYDNLSPAERERLGQLIRQSRGKRANLTSREQRRVFELVKKAVTGS
jgi:hypothetical protein